MNTRLAVSRRCGTGVVCHPCCHKKICAIERFRGSSEHHTRAIVFVSNRFVRSHPSLFNGNCAVLRHDDVWAAMLDYVFEQHAKFRWPLRGGSAEKGWQVLHDAHGPESINPTLVCGFGVGSFLNTGWLRGFLTKFHPAFRKELYGFRCVLYAFANPPWHNYIIVAK